MPIDTLKVAKRLRDAGFTEPQAEAVIAAVQEGTESADLATKQDLRAEIADLRNELKAEIADLRSELRQAELRLEAKIEAVKADILSRVFGLIVGTLVVNIVAIVGAMFAVAKLVGHCAPRPAEPVCGRPNERAPAPTRSSSEPPRVAARDGRRAHHAARSARAAEGAAGNRLPRCRVTRPKCTVCRRVSPGPRRNRLCRGTKCGDRIPLG